MTFDEHNLVPATVERLLDRLQRTAVVVHAGVGPSRAVFFPWAQSVVGTLFLLAAC
ncbi:hypothetical protein FHR84_000600 [Actinopolyspora biskrensis]|uniref:Uncharacterized protein n=1 Tax=Actinopolyspora biskrensis TaxID=1470178 RepID=A0A852Z0V1_9ACTN|nr:hypothetical protein [Actinopolyspora biskrensis]NYH77286.1 hypothetical protein [Actinopolyspora biskrensis]